PEPAGLADDSRAVTPGAWFVAVRGSQQDGHRYIPDALARGAAVLVVERPEPLVRVPQVVVRSGREAAIALARAWYGDPAAHLTLVGITGTNGKTTTTALVRHLLNRDGSAGSIGTLGAYDGRGDAVPSTAGNLTTPGAVDLQATLAALRARGVAVVAMETSSHSLAQGRLDGLSFAAAVFTNVTRDHLDYHGTMEDYVAAKYRLAALLAPDGTAVVNADDPAWEALPGGLPVLTFGLERPADLRAEGLVLGAAGSRFRLGGRAGGQEVDFPLLGDFNVSNALAAAGAALSLGLPLADVAGRLSAAPQVPGRMERIARRPCTILRDYAHTPDALERALRTLRPLTRGRLLVLFGCGGDRDRGKRPMMGRLAADLADLAIVTSDNPRTEDPGAIIADVVAGMGSVSHRVEPDRRRAIALALEEAGEDDTLLLAGKGHETYQVIGTEKQPFDEREIVARLGAR
ncbi:MAG TPA: UDP-N-acetylmuramoyl-L-alanyl-D-glutamate--2,6-diaminopimelate ligase, partial [Gemmatimonadales bacterium]|nr:UDP-N-acetylmuramoyl-L-alanyl-D-glutamate--2,6-diaminopimelate ligase [Gemmatimonadales bacterium]